MKHNVTNLDNYCKKAIAAGATGALITKPSLVVTAPWVQWKCKFGCPDYGKWYCCLPQVPSFEETRRVIDTYNRLILLHFQYRFELPQWPPDDAGYKRFKKDVDFVIELERRIFLDGYYRAFAMPHTPCQRCKNCPPIEGQPCYFPEKVRPSMESIGIDVYQTAHNHNLPIRVIRSEKEVCNFYALVLVD